MSVRVVSGETENVTSHQHFCISNCKLDFSIFTGVQLLCCILGRYFTFRGQQRPWVSEFGSERWFIMIRALLSVIQVQHGINQSDHLIQYSCKWGNLMSQYGTVQTQRKYHHVSAPTSSAHRAGRLLATNSQLHGVKISNSTPATFSHLLWSNRTKIFSSRKGYLSCLCKSTQTHTVGQLFLAHLRIAVYELGLLCQQ